MSAPSEDLPAAASQDVLARLAAVIESRRGGDPEQSYVARLFHKGTDAILKKIGEEATETVMDARIMGRLARVAFLVRGHRAVGP